MEVGITKMSSRGQVVIPLDFRSDFKEGDKLIVMRDGNKITLEKSVPEDALLSEESFAETWLNEEEGEAWKNL